ncbi:MAG: polysaccharide pyruvyl transferase family protein [Deltaproteobacteria bacterium]|nr:polysaccharide pyruvyl transferase family protein [Deltaproteobacteria bacterium]
MKVLFIGHDTCKNRGCEAIVRCSALVIRRYLQDASFIVLMDSERMQYDSSIVDTWEVPVRFVPLLYRRTVHTVLSSIKHRLGLPPGYPEGLYWQRNMHTYYSKADLVVAVGGDNFTESYGLELPTENLNCLQYAQYLGKATVVWGASIGPFNNEDLRRIATEVLSKSTLITVRESWSQDYLESIGITDNVRLVADPAFVLKGRRTERSALTASGPSNCVIGLGISALRSGFLGTERKTYEQIMTQFVQHAIDSLNATVYLVPHVMYEGNDDYIACRNVMRSVNRKNSVLMAADYDMQADEIKDAISQCDYFIGYRTHSTIASLSSNVPTIAIAYSKKAFGILQQAYGHADYVIDGRSITLENLIDRFNSLVSNRETIVESLRRRMPELKQLSMQGGAYLAAALQKE